MRVSKSEPKFALGDLVRSTIRGLTHNIFEVEAIQYSDHKDLWGYYVRDRKHDNLWLLTEDQLEYPDALDALASIQP